MTSTFFEFPFALLSAALILESLACKALGFVFGKIAVRASRRFLVIDFAVRSDALLFRASISVAVYLSLRVLTPVFCPHGIWRDILENPFILRLVSKAVKFTRPCVSN